MIASSAAIRQGFSMTQLFIALSLMVILVMVLFLGVHRSNSYADEHFEMTVSKMANVTMVTAANFEQEVMQADSKPVVLVCCSPPLCDPKKWEEFAGRNSSSLKVVVLNSRKDSCVSEHLASQSGGVDCFVYVYYKRKLLPIRYRWFMTVSELEWLVNTSLRSLEK
ncbi:MAG: hypothetical protein K2Z81_08465 [Cyanobacteria bacterium]|nr:hypothetical protein [Cyanobacteriota bacterium]